MDQQVVVVAISDFAYKGRAIYAGQAIEMLPVEAAIEGRRGHVSLDPATRPYRRRDMTAEQPQAAPVVSAPSVPEPTVKRRRGRPRKKAIL